MAGRVGCQGVSLADPLADHLAPDCVARLERAARRRFGEAVDLIERKRFLAAVYLVGYASEMCLTAALFRAAGFTPTMPISRDARQRRMAQARQLVSDDGQTLMSGDPHPPVGWARYLQWQRTAAGNLTGQDRGRLREAVRRAGVIYRHWRPELRYKVTDVRPDQLAEVRLAAEWFVQGIGRL